jgi:hypothetical protein
MCYGMLSSDTNVLRIIVEHSVNIPKHRKHYIATFVRKAFLTKGAFFLTKGLIQCFECCTYFNFNKNTAALSMAPPTHSHATQILRTWSHHAHTAARNQCPPQERSAQPRPRGGSPCPDCNGLGNSMGRRVVAPAPQQEPRAWLTSGENCTFLKSK